MNLLETPNEGLAFLCDRNEIHSCHEKCLISPEFSIAQSASLKSRARLGKGEIDIREQHLLQLNHNLDQQANFKSTVKDPYNLEDEESHLDI